MIALSPMAKNARMGELLELAKSVYSGDFELLCSEVTLEWSNPEVAKPLVGAGYIRSGKDSAIVARITAPANEDDFRDPVEPVPAGRLIPRDRYASLRLKDHRGDSWRTHEFAVDIWPFLFGTRVNMNKQVASVTRQLEGTGGQAWYLRVILRSAKRIPVEQYHHYEEKKDDRVVGWGTSKPYQEFTLCGSPALVNRIDSDWLDLVVNSNQPITRAWVDAIASALEFMTGYDCTPPAYELRSPETNWMQASSGPFRRYSTLLPGPASFQFPTYGIEFWTFFSRLVEALLAAPEQESAIRGELRGIRQGSNSTLQTASLTLTAGIESLAAIFVPDSMVAAPSVTEVAVLRSAIAECSVADALKKRAAGIVASLLSVRAIDRLKAWARDSDCPQELVAAWQRLRNLTAHGTILDGSQENWDLYSSNVELLYRLTAWYVGYEGQIVAVSQHGRPNTRVTRSRQRGTV